MQVKKNEQKLPSWLFDYDVSCRATISIMDINAALNCHANCDRGDV